MKKDWYTVDRDLSSFGPDIFETSGRAIFGVQLEISALLYYWLVIIGICNALVWFLIRNSLNVTFLQNYKIVIRDLRYNNYWFLYIKDRLFFLNSFINERHPLPLWGFYLISTSNNKFLNLIKYSLYNWNINSYGIVCKL